MRLDHIKLENFACFESASLDLAHRFNLIVGDNAKGKTSWLNGVAAGMEFYLYELDVAGRPRSAVHEFVHVKCFRHADAITMEQQYPNRVDCYGTFFDTPVAWYKAISRHSAGSLIGEFSQRDVGGTDFLSLIGRVVTEVMTGSAKTIPTLGYYGTNRLTQQALDKDIPTQSPASRLAGYRDCLVASIDAKRLLSWFKTQELAALQQGKPISSLEACRAAILSCIPDATKVWFDVQQDALLLETNGGIQSFSNLSDGFRNMLAMVADIAVRCATLNPHLGAHAALQTPGIVLIDEIDLHLHPRWQRRVVGDLLKAFPKVQFVATTHSPFIIQSLPPIDGVRLINLDAPDQDQPFANQSLEDIAESVQEVEMPQRSHRWQSMLKAAEEYYAVLNSPTDRSSAELDRLRVRLDELSLPFSDDPAFQAFLKTQRLASETFGGQG